MTARRVRLASELDEDAIALLRSDAGGLIAEQRGGPALLDSISSCQDLRTWVAVIGEAVAGIASVEILDGAATLRELFVDPSCRGVGLGDLLLVEALDFATAQGCHRLDSVALPGDRSTKNFFEAHGMVTRLLTVSQSLP